jgi:hypothetical protein
MLEGNQPNREESFVAKPSPQRTRETVTLLGPEGEEFARKLSAYFIGQTTLKDLGPGCDIAPGGTLRMHLDQASFEALELHKP